MDAQLREEALPSEAGGELRLHGRIMVASNATFVGRIGDLEVVYKPDAGERPLWDFPDGRLSRREEAAYLVSDSLGWGIAPATWRQDGPHGEGMVQRWCQPDEHQQPVRIVPEGEIPAGHHHVLDGIGADDQPVSLVHEDGSALRRMTLFDVVINNADRKGGHVLPMPDGHRYGVDHGVCFHHEPKLRTILWGWAGDPVPAEDLDRLQLLATRLRGDLGHRLADLLDPDDLAALEDRCRELISEARFPHPDGSWPPIPWPPL